PGRAGRAGSRRNGRGIGRGARHARRRPEASPGRGASLSVASALSRRPSSAPPPHCSGSTPVGTWDTPPRVTDALLVFTTLPTPEKAADLARMLVEEGLVACGNVLPAVRSIYKWEGKVQDENEVMLLLK